MIQYAVALMPHHDVSVLEQYIPYINQVQCMGIETIGKQAEPFASQVCELIASIHHTYPHLPISVDGGVSDVSAQKLKDAGATMLVSGSFVYHADDVQSAIQKLKESVIY
jgi:ribulose-phosphate 3-epimerase